ncbi:type IV secretion system protein [Escherichia coli]|nr:conjugal transfer protein TrbJ [Escherichia coli]
MLKELFSVILIGCMCSNVAHAYIPVVDPTSIAKTVEEGLARAKEAADNLQQLKTQYEQSIKYAEDQKKRLEGFTDFSRGFDTASSYMRGSLKDIDSDSQIGLDSLRKKYSLTSSDANTQRRYDAVLKQINFYEQFNKSMYKRAERVQSLQSLFASATTPQQKADIANQLSIEKMTIELQLKQYELASNQMSVDENARQEQARNEWLSSHSYKR